MNKLTMILVALFLMTNVGINAQTATTNTPATNYSILANKVKKSNESLTDVKKNVKVKYWTQRAELMIESYDVNRQYLMPGTQQIIIKSASFYGEPKDIKTSQDKDGTIEQYIYDKVNVTFRNGAVESMEETQPIYENPLPEALKSLEKAEELDVEKKESKDIKKLYDNLKKLFEREAIEKFTRDNFEVSLNNFKAILAINDKPVMEGAIDTVTFFNAGMTASRIEKNDESIKYYELARKYNHKDPNLYVFLKQKYFEVGDTAKGLEVIEDGFQKNPENQSVIIELINYYLLRGEANKALVYLQKAKEGDPNNISFLFAEATLYDKSGDKEKAKETYLKCIEMDPQYFNGYYNLGVMYYNEAVRLYEEANKINDQKEYEAARAKGDEALASALPHMEKAHEIDPTETTTMETLKTLYYRLKMTEKYEAIMKKLGQ